ncbi:PDZ domain-containing protein [Flavobacterium sp. NST-5]|uniref:PDZ domain-containing protein n=1 Tax=Flavobacterium ichthyis TaxID=2698827 RepID=A0ABW9Z6F9_9FLAO|nr:trypsin-like peptidase domain-containing protein [Flavobacterium ichthyis]NBL64443.1 PDZ domain-containing protein [Flavobacterium ichthyis]
MKNFSGLFLVSLLSGATTLGAYKLFFEKESLFFDKKNVVTTAPLSYTKNVGLGAETVDFTAAADNAVHTVVHVKNVSYRTVSNPILEYYYGYKGGQQQAQVGTGSGVIISEDGYIVTNNHVIQDASELEVTMNDKKTYKAKLVGTDSKMDIALLKIDTGTKLPYAVFGDSDNVKVGEWVLAVGNPYNLTSTVTAGIVSAKARNLDQRGIQSFIQTDAAVNPGNSGGALVNTRGELIGINTMISSMTGSYVGYSFAVPSNITRKIIEDLMEYGNVQRGILGVEGRELNAAASKEMGLDVENGFYVGRVNQNSGAFKAGLKKGDIITKIDNRTISGFADLNTILNTKRPNDVVKVTFKRGNKTYETQVTLIKNDIMSYDFMGMELEDLRDSEKRQFNLGYGVKIKETHDKEFGDLAGGIILSIDNVKAKDVETVSEVLRKKSPNQMTKLEILSRNGEVERYILAPR